MKLSKDELIEKITGYAIDDETKMSLLEDVSDSIDKTEPVDLSAYVAKADYDELKRKYIERFSAGAEAPTPDPEPEEEEKKDITIDDLFVEDEN